MAPRIDVTRLPGDGISLKCLNYLTKSTRRSVATSSRSCGTNTRSISSPLALLIIAGVGGWRGYQYLEAKKAAEAGAAFDKAVELSEANKHAEAEAAFADLAAKAPSGYRMLARLRIAAEVANRDPQAAAKLFDEIAADRSVGSAEQDLARIRAAQLLLDTHDLSEHAAAS